MKKILITLSLLAMLSSCTTEEKNITELLEFSPVTAQIADLDNVISISGSVKSDTSTNVESPYAISENSMLIQTGDYLEEGQEIAYLTPNDISDMMEQMYETYDEAIKELNDLTVTTTTYTFKAPVEGYVRNIVAQEGESIESVMDDHGYLAQIVDSKGNLLYNLVGVSGTITSVADLEGDRVKVGTAIVYASKSSDDFSDKIKEVNDLTESINTLKKYEEIGLSVTAPVGGVVSSLGFKQDQTTGETATVNAGETLYSVVDPSTYYVSASLSETNYSLVSIGSVVQVEVPALNQVLSGEVTYVSASGNNGAFPIEVLVTNGAGLQLGMSANLRIIASSYEARLNVPIDSVFTYNDGTRYVLLESDTPTNPLEADPRAQIVTTGKTDGKKIEIVEGLTEGQVVLQPVMSQYIPETQTSENNDDMIFGY